MINAVCTLFEKHYHHGVAVLSNSLVRNGFKGSIYVGYRGSLPEWCNSAKPDASLSWEGATTIEISQDVKMHLLPMTTNAHFTNYKAHFMLELWDGPAKNADAMFYFDPDIVFVAQWHFFQDWVKCGVAVSEDVNSPVAQYHPRRVAWREYFGQFGHNLQLKEAYYVNAGFVGVKKEDKNILVIWKKMMEELALRLGGLNRSSVSGDAIPVEEQGDFSPFGNVDQDVLNAAIEAYDGKVSFAGKEGMAFIAGTPLIPHALGKIKPWVLKPITYTLQGHPPRTVDKVFWQYAKFPIQSHTNWKISSMRFKIKWASLLGRFYRRSE
ncbi:MAG: hypothetical protein IT245_01015 [Bacteroidia bacterium]|nr:hypothetical protein [Bacteroidia bacterium]